MGKQLLCGLCGVSVAEVGGLRDPYFDMSKETNIAIKLRGDGNKVCRTCWGFLCLLEDKEDLVDTIADLLEEVEDAEKAYEVLEDEKKDAEKEATEYRDALEDFKSTINGLM